MASFILPDRRDTGDFTSIHTDVEKNGSATNFAVLDILLRTGCKIDRYLKLFQAIGAGDKKGG